MTPRRAVFPLLFALALVFAGARALFAFDDTDWQLILDTLRKQDQLIHQRLEAYKTRYLAEAASEALEMERLTHERARLALWQATASDPWEIRDALAGFSRLRQDVARLSQRPEQAWANLEQSVALLDSFKERLTELANQEIPERFRKDIEPSRDSMAELSGQVAAMRDAIAAQTTPLRELAAQVRTAESELSASLTPAWKGYYTEAFPTPFSPRFLKVLDQDMEDWELWRNLGSELLTTPHNKETMRKALWAATFSALAVLAVSLGAIILAARRGRLSGPARGSLPKTALCVSVGVFFMALSRGAPFFLFTTLSSIGEIALTAALVHLTRLRQTRPGSYHPPVLWPTWRLFALGLFLEAVRVPEVLMTPILVVWLLLATLVCNRRHNLTPPNQHLDRGITRAQTLLLPAVAAVALCGLPQTAILCASALFYVTLALRYSSLTTGLLGQRMVVHHKGKTPVLLGIAAGAGYPFFFLCFLFCFLWLLSTQFGGENVFLEILTTETQVESVGISLKKLALLLIGFYVAKAMIALSATFIAEVASRRRAVERGAKDSLLTINSYAWWGLYVLYVMSVLGLSLTSVAVVAGGLSVGIGFGMQTMVNNFISGLILLFGRSVQAGDTIQLGDAWGVVKEVNIRNTEVLTLENATVFVPNSELISGKIVNWSHKDPSVRRDICVGVAYGSDTARVRELLLAAAAECPAVLGNPAPAVLHWDFGASTLDFRLRVWLADVSNAVTQTCAIREAIDRLFREADIEIAFPQTDLHLRTAPVLEEFLQTQRREQREAMARLSERLDALERKAGAPSAAGATDKDVPDVK